MLAPEIVYLAAHIAVIDNRIFDKEWYFLDSLINKYNYGEAVRNNILGILMNHSDKIELEPILVALKDKDYAERLLALKIALYIAYEDGNFGAKEEALFQTIRNKIDISKMVFEQFQNEVKEIVQGVRENTIEEIDNIDLKDRYERVLFSQNDYETKIKEMSVIAKEDIDYSVNVVEKSNKLASGFPNMMERRAKAFIKGEKHLDGRKQEESVEDLFKQLISSINGMLENTNEMLDVLNDRQKAAADSFTVSFMGRTKAGKSTLHSVLLGGLNSDFIGNGSERTTRYNYVYDFRGLRIIDTPGIGAPGGQEDVEVAEEVADESDIICYVVTTDSIQETEFNFLNKLKERNKPVIILLNKKENFVRSSKKKQAFLDNPLGWYENEGEDAISGHLKRIRTYVSMKHDYHNYDIVPVHLLAAKLALNETEPEVKEKLMLGSRINEFLSVLKGRIISSGTLQRSQTIYNSPIYRLSNNINQIYEQKEQLVQIKNDIKMYSNQTVSKIKKEGQNTRNQIIEQCDSIFNNFICREVREFAYKHYSLSRKNFEEEWDKFLKVNNVEKRLKEEYEYQWRQFEESVTDILNDFIADMEFSLQFGNLSSITLKKVFDAKFVLNIGAALAGVVSLFFMTNPVGWVLMGVGAVLGIAGMFIKSKSKQVEIAKEELYKSIVKELTASKEKTMKTILCNYDKNYGTVENSISAYYNVIDKLLEMTNEDLGNLAKTQAEYVNDLNKALASRIVNFMTQRDTYNIQDEKSLSGMIVDREFRKVLKIQDSKIFTQPLYIDEEHVSELLQEKIIINKEN